jgi:hypothetical protein
MLEHVRIGNLVSIGDNRDVLWVCVTQASEDRVALKPLSCPAIRDRRWEILYHNMVDSVDVTGEAIAVLFEVEWFR